jgi:hypothetical protein
LALVLLIAVSACMYFLGRQILRRFFSRPDTA